MAFAAVSLPPLEDDLLWGIMARADELGIRLELTDTGMTWEVSPGLLHQELLVTSYGSIERSLTSQECECYRAIDVPIRFPSGVVKRPDISIFCRRPLEEEGFVKSTPEAVIEITSPGYEAKDLVSGPPLYLANGVKDVVVLDRSRGVVHHWSATGIHVLPSPAAITLACGCLVTV